MYIAFEGIDGCGKTTQLENLKNRFKNTWFTAEPYYYSKAVKPLLKHFKYQNPAAHNLLFLACHAEYVTRQLSHKLKSGVNIISDRSVLSSLAYSYGINGNLMTKMKNAYRMFNVDTYPDIAIYLKLEPEKMEQRLDRKDSIESMPLEYFKRVNEGYEKLMADKTIPTKWIVIDASKPRKEILEEILSKLPIKKRSI